MTAPAELTRPVAPATLPAGEPTLIDHIAAFAAHVGPDAVPERVSWQTKLCLLDTIGCMVSGATEADGLRLFAAEMAGDPGGAARVVGQTETMSPEGAARVNGYLGDLFELNDLIGGHASIATVAAALAVADEERPDGKTLLKACIAGIESTTRIHFAYYEHMKPYTEMAITPPAIPNAMGSAAAAAIISGAGEAEVRNAMGIGMALATWGPAELTFGDGGTVKPMLHGSMPASVGVTSARYAMGGMTGPRTLMESDIGLYATIGRGYKRWALVNPEGFHLDEPRRKLHASCGYTHMAIDLMGRLFREMGPERLAAARAIRIAVPAYIMPAVVKTAPPTSPNNARFHINYCAALAGTGIDVILPEHSNRFDDFFTPAVADLMCRISLVLEPSFVHYAECRIEVEEADGAVVTVEGKAPRGAPDNPLGEQGVREKFARLVGHRMSATDIATYCDRVMQLEREADVDWLLAPFVGG
ncbi:MmgE/PrpD family protein [Novosphingobium cyanobacteriorum]|uniref:MmgE/PrpD family protein n=1 Tax=Novosphingobium cyanobacteriorum TaxID=3024215 RepID=A0ABT6CLY0_9SPHN|nr:MmgE/PrpD family protein [Novosphingobium cyanobacteriorum]MDF8334926.1 MmgE/PrpD family protein [Novosphingobium cyanobacteriorum]